MYKIRHFAGMQRKAQEKQALLLFISYLLLCNKPLQKSVA